MMRQIIMDGLAGLDGKMLTIAEENSDCVIVKRSSCIVTYC